jgi:hypothetical protein
MNKNFSVYRKIVNAPDVAIHGQVATKPHIVELMLDLAEYHGDRSKRLIDPGCGEGAFTVAAAVRLVRSGKGRSFDDLADCIVAVEKDPEAAAVCRSRLVDMLTAEGVTRPTAKRLAERWVITGDFLEGEFGGDFDFVVGNPPYVRQEAIPKPKLERYRTDFDCFYDRADLYVAFFEKSLKLLGPEGKLALICPDRFARNNYGRKLRALIADRYSVEYVLDLAQASPFQPDVTCYPGIFVIARRPRGRHVDYFRLTDATPKECEFVRRKKSNGVVTYHRYDGWFDGEQKWSIESPAHLDLLRRLEAQCVALGDESSGCKVGIGVATGADDVFIVDQDFDIEPELLMPLVTTKDIVTGSVKWRGRCVINPFVGDTTELIDLKKFPRARAHFMRHKSRLVGRNVAKRDLDRWYRTIDRIYPGLQRQHKLLIPDIKAENLIVLENGELYPHHNLYYVASEAWDLRALRTILRSSIGKFFVWMYGVKMRSDFLRFQAQYLRRICVPMLAKVKRPALAKLIAADRYDDQDKLESVTAELYGLSDADMELVRGIAAPRLR